MKNRKWLSFFPVMFGIGALMAASVLGYWKLTGSTGNIITMGSYQNQIIEEYKVPEQVNPGQKVNKVVNVSNTGTVDSLIRVKVRKAFGTTDKQGNFVEETKLDPEKILVVYHTDYWDLKSDGYFYYKEVLKAGTETKEPLMEEYCLSEDTGNEYKGKEGRIFVMLESIQAQADAPEIWNMTYKDLGIERPKEPEGNDTEVVYRGTSAGFEVTESTTDLFASFKNLYPGCARTQNIDIKNHSSEQIEIYLRAEETGQKKMTAKERELLKKLLNQYARIEVVGENGKLYSGPVSGNLKGSGSTMKSDIFLGTFQANEEKRLLVKLSLSEEMDNEFCNLQGKVKWVFTAKGEEGTEKAVVSVPKTGDQTEILMWIVLLVNSGLCIAGAFWLERKHRKKE